MFINRNDNGDHVDATSMYANEITISLSLSNGSNNKMSNDCAAFLSYTKKTMC